MSGTGKDAASQPWIDSMTKESDLELFNEWISYDPWNGEFFYKKKPNRNKPAGSKAGGKSKKAGYLQISVLNKRHQANRVAFLMFHGWLPNQIIDHHDGDPSNNRISNLRPATPGQNQYNKMITKANTSGVKGVSFCRKSKRFHAKLKVSKVQKFIGSFETLEEAAEAIKAARITHHGEFARHQ